jgi:NDP-sugar pyrophosphorylase family protein
LEICYSKEEQPLGTAGPLGLIKELSDPFVVMNGDLLTTLNFNKMIEYHTAQAADFTIGAFKRDVKIDFGVVESDTNGKFVGFKEKPTFHFEVSMGVNIIGHSALKYIKKGNYLDMPDLILQIKDNGGHVCCYREECFWLDIGRMDDYALAQKEFSENELRFLGEPL